MSRSYATQGAAMLLAVVVQGEELLRFFESSCGCCALVGL